MPKVVLATTMWSKVSEKEGAGREIELKTRFWKELVDSGSLVERFDHTRKSAWKIVDSLIPVSEAVLLPHEMVDIRLRLHVVSLRQRGLLLIGETTASRRIT